MLALLSISVIVGRVFDAQFHHTPQSHLKARCFIVCLSLYLASPPFTENLEHLLEYQLPSLERKFAYTFVQDESDSD